MDDPSVPQESYPTFDETYPKYEFADLVYLVLVATGWAVDRLGRRRPEISGADNSAATVDRTATAL